MRYFNDVTAIENRIFYYLCGLALFGSNSVAIGNIFLGLATAGLLHRLIVKRDDLRERFFPGKIFFALMAALFLAAAISLIGAGDLSRGVNNLFNYYLYRTIPFFAIVLFFRDKKKILDLSLLLLTSFLVNNSNGLYQAAFKLGKTAAAGRFSGMLPYMVQATVLSMGIPVLLLGVMKVRDRKWKVFLSVVLVISLAGLLFNATRGAWMACAAASLVVTFFAAESKLKYFVGVLCVTAAVCGVFHENPKFLQRAESTFDLVEYSKQNRMTIWQTAGKMVQDHPLTGVGAGQFKPQFQQKYILEAIAEMKAEQKAADAKAEKQWQAAQKKSKAKPAVKKKQAQQHAAKIKREQNQRNRNYNNLKQLDHAHNNVIHETAELGLLGGVVYIAMWLYFLYYALRGWLKERNIGYLIFLGAILGLQLHGLSEYTFGSATSMKIFWMISALGLTWVHITGSNGDEEKSESD